MQDPEDRMMQNPEDSEHGAPPERSLLQAVWHQEQEKGRGQGMSPSEVYDPTNRDDLRAMTRWRGDLPLAQASWQEIFSNWRGFFSRWTQSGRSGNSADNTAAAETEGRRKRWFKRP